MRKNLRNIYILQCIYKFYVYIRNRKYRKSSKKRRKEEKKKKIKNI